MSIKIALAGNPNSGKTTMFNDLTGSSQRVGNWPGVTVEKKEGKLKGNKDVIIQDLPGIYSLSPYTLEEVVSREYLVNEKPDAIINIVDATNIERNLYLTTQLTELGIPVVIALNMIDVTKKHGDQVNLAKMGEAFGCVVVETSAVKGQGTKEAAQKAIELVKAKKAFTPKHTFSDPVEKCISEIESLISDSVKDVNTRWYAIKVFERDQKVMEKCKFSPALMASVNSVIEACEKEMDDISESIITGERYNYIGKVLKSFLTKKNTSKITASDKIDRVITNRVLALPIFAAIMFLVYYLSISTIGVMGTDWVNDGVFGDGFHLVGIGGGEYEEAVGEFELAQVKIEAFLGAAEEAEIDIEAVSEALEFDAEAFEDEAEAEAAAQEADAAIADFIAQAADVTAEAEVEDEDGNVETFPVAIADFEAALEIGEPDPAEFGVWVPGVPVVIGNGLEAAGTPDWLYGLIIDGIVAGVGAVLGFLPQMLVLFLCLAILEDCGYMSRIAFIMDRIFRKFGLSGKSFIPMLITTGCGVPGIMASRTIESDSDRRMTVMTTIFVPCGAKLPIIALIAGALFNNDAWVASSAYFVGVAAIVISGIMLKKTKRFAGEPSPFVLELPAYHAPRVKGVLRTTFGRGWAFIKKATTIVMLSTIGVWFLSAFNWSMQMVDAGESMLADIGNFVAPLFAPLGWGDWRAAVATFTGLIAKENVVGTFGILFGFEEVAEDGIEIWTNLQAAFTQLSAYSFLVFNLLCAPCFAAIGATRREMMSGKWTSFAVIYQCVFAYAISLVIFQLGTLFTGGGFGVATVFAILVVAGIGYMLFRKQKYNGTGGSTSVSAGSKTVIGR